MSAPVSSFGMQDQDVLGELLHSLSQPLTSLRCSLELTFDEAAAQQQAAVGMALQQAERVIGMIQLMREYLDAEQPEADHRRVSLDRVLRAVVDDMCSLAEVHEVGLGLEGACSATIPLAELRLRLALQYLMMALIETAPAGSRVVLRLEEGSTESALRAEVQPEQAARPASTVASSIPATLRRVRIAIAQRILESSGTFLTFENCDAPPFLLRVPRMLAASRTVV